MFKGYTGMELLEAKLAALIVVLAAVSAVVVVVVQNKQSGAFKGFYPVAFSLSCGTCLKCIQV